MLSKDKGRIITEGFCKKFLIRKIKSIRGNRSSYVKELKKPVFDDFGKIEKCIDYDIKIEPITELTKKFIDRDYFKMSDKRFDRLVVSYVVNYLRLVFVDLIEEGKAVFATKLLSIKLIERRAVSKKYEGATYNYLNFDFINRKSIRKKFSALYLIEIKPGFLSIIKQCKLLRFYDEHYNIHNSNGRLPQAGEKASRKKNKRK